MDSVKDTAIKANTAPGAAIYTWLLALNTYDMWVLWLSFSYWWKCPTKSVLLPFYRDCMSQNHLDIGPGSGYFPSHARPKEGTNITLFDLNETSLKTSEKRVKKSTKAEVQVVHGDIFGPPSSLSHRKFESISLFNILHCLPGPPASKAEVLGKLKANLEDDGVLYGATILGYGASHNWLGRFFMRVYNQKGIFGNEEDDVETFRKVLEKNYRDISTQVVGTVLLFVAKKPIY